MLAPTLDLTAANDACPAAPWSEDSWRLDGLHCVGCSATIERLVSAFPGVQRVSVNPVSEALTVRWMPADTDPSRFLSTLPDHGYAATAWRAGEADAMNDLAARHKRERRESVWRTFVAGFCMMQVMMLATPVYVAGPGDLTPDLRRLMDLASWVLTLPVMAFSARPFFDGAWRALRRRRVSMDVPVALGVAVTFAASSVVAFNPGGVLGSDVYFDSLTMFVFVLLGGRLFEQRARHRAVAVLEQAVDRLPQMVERVIGEGEELAADEPRTERVKVSSLAVGDCIRTLAGDAFAADGVVVAGAVDVDESIVTGEAMPVVKRAGDHVLAGSLNLTGPVTVRVHGLGEDTRYHSVVRLLSSALRERPASLALPDRVAAVFLWAVLGLAAAAGVAWAFIDPARAPWVVASVLIVTCPCALGLAAPVTLLAAASRLAREGVLVHRVAAIERLAAADCVMLDKTGTVTEDRLLVAHHEWLVRDVEDGAMLGRASALAALSRHPAAQAVAQMHGVPADARWSGVTEHAGLGLSALASDGSEWRLGSRRWVAGADPRAGSAADLDPSDGPQVFFGPVGAPCLRVDLVEAVRTDAAAAVQRLQAAGLPVTLLSGDTAPRAVAVSQALGIAAAYGGLQPADKLAHVAAAQAAGRCVLMVGDGINDAPVLARADVSFAMGHAARLAQRQADFVLLRDRLDDVVFARQVARHAMRTLKLSLAWSAAYNAVCVPLALTGWLPPWAAGIGMALSSLGVVVHSQRVLQLRRDPPTSAPVAVSLAALDPGAGVQPSFAPRA